ncbi:glucose-6-phosphate 1-dehydrogenase [Rhodobacterales bacterium HTCC2150]|nr:glucose-6-phosphate 1-dehydrogenase [Rhodobacterales bacterium HTCC2150] [Rhodobacteraceae bacterium HTCC2150]
MVSRIIPVSPFDLVIFGGTGDLARRKILPGLFRRYQAGQIAEGSRIIGAARGDFSDKSFRKFVSDAFDEFVAENKRDKKQIAEFLKMFHYVTVDAMGENGWKELAKLVRPDVVQAFYFSVGPSLFGELASRLHSHNIANAESRVVVEKPFGRDLETARTLNRDLAEHFDESQIYRIDHYLGKETVQNLMALRFANVLFEPLWNAQYVDHVQITAAETVGIGGRGAYYNKSGAMRDMVQNHLMQLLCLTAMEPPSHFDPDAVRDEKLKVIRSLDPVEDDDIVRGQYRKGVEGPSFLEEVDDENSKTECFVAMKVGIANWRWKGTPFYLRTGKRMKARMSEIVVTFKDIPHSIFDDDAGSKANVLTIRLQPDEGMDLSVTIKEPGPGGMRLIDVPLDMTFADAFGEEKAADVPDAYERLIMDVIRGNQTLFMRGDEVEAAWKWTDPIIKGWAERSQKPIAYDQGSAGPEDAMMLMHKDGRRWREIEEL